MIEPRAQGCPTPVDAQLRQLAELPKYGGGPIGGKAISALTLRAAGMLAREHEQRTGLTPYLYPTPTGGVSVEWDKPEPGRFEVYVEALQ